MTKMKTSIKASLVATAIAMLPFAGHAAGLGSIHVFSGLGQPLRAEVELNATADELQSLSARVASAEAFREANLQFTPALTALRFAVERRGARSVVKITSDRPINEPFVDLLIEINWAAGRLLREYTFLLDPVPAGTPAPVAGQAVPVRPVAAPAPASAPAASRPAASRNGQASGTVEGRRYEIRKGDTLHRIAEANRPDGASLDQVLVALFRENPDAFEGNNINRLRAGAIVTVPSESQMRAIEPAQARREVVAQAADFDSYRRKLAGTVASRPAAAEEAPSRSGSGAIVPKVSESARTASGDQVKVSGAPERAVPADLDARLARLQALEEELAARDKALDEANSRVAALEASVRQMQQLLNLRSDNLAQLQQQAGGRPAESSPAPAEPPPPAATPAAEPPAPAAAEVPAAAPAASPAPVPKPVEPPVEEPGFIDSVLEDPAMLAAGGGVLVLLLAYAGLKARQRRQQQAGDDANQLLSELPPVTNSVFGATGGQSVNTGESSVLHTDFSQSGLSAIDTDEGVDPVAEADVYMAYGRDAQAEEILLDALKSDPSRMAIYLKLLEIYSQRKNLKAFEGTATDLYSRTGGEGGDWDKAAEMGRRLDPDNPLYRSSSAGALGAGLRTPGPAAGAAAGTAAAAYAVAASQDVELPDLEAYTSVASGPEKAEPIRSADSEVDIEVLPEIDSNALDFDLDAGLELGSPAGAAMPPATRAESAPVDAAPSFEIDLDTASPEEPARNASPAADIADSMHRTVVAQGSEFSVDDQALEFDLGGDMNPGSFGGAGELSLDSTVVDSGLPLSADEPAVSPDLEKTAFDSSLLDFDFNLDDASPEAPAPSMPSLDLTSIDLNLEGTPAEPSSPFAAQGETVVDGGFDLSIPESSAATPSDDVIEEVNTKLELARAYEEMGDAEGARELIEEVLREGSAEQREAARKLAERLG